MMTATVSCSVWSLVRGDVLGWACSLPSARPHWHALATHDGFAVLKCAGLCSQFPCGLEWRFVFFFALCWSSSGSAGLFCINDAYIGTLTTMRLGLSRRRQLTCTPRRSSRTPRPAP
eukprot:2097876-Rhodomonas_salina.1